MTRFCKTHATGFIEQDVQWCTGCSAYVIEDSHLQTNTPTVTELLKSLKESRQAPALVEHFRKEARRVGTLQSTAAIQLAASYDDLANLIVELLK